MAARRGWGNPEHLRNAVRDMPAEEARDLLLGVIEDLMPGQDEARVMRITALGFTRKQAQILATLEHGRVVSKAALFETMYAARPDAPHPKVIDAFLCRIRRMIAAAGYGFEIRTIRGGGYQLVRLTDDPLPWAGHEDRHAR